MSWLLLLGVMLGLGCGAPEAPPEAYLTQPIDTAPTPAPPPPIDAVQLTCVLPGLQTLTGRDLQKAGLSLSAIEPAQLTLVHIDQAVPLLLRQADPRRFGPDDQLFWYSSGPLGLRYPYINTREMYYPPSQEFALRLTPGALQPLRFEPLALDASTTATTATMATVTPTEVHSVLRLEENPIHDFNTVDGGSREVPLTDFIYWVKLTYPETDRTSGSITVPFELTADQVARQAELRIQLAAATRIGANFNRNQHSIGLELNGEPLTTTSFTLPIERVNIQLEAGRLLVGRNTLRVSVLKPITPAGFSGLANDIAFLDWIEVDIRQTHYTGPGLLTLPAVDTPDSRTLPAEHATFNLGGVPDPAPLLLDLTAHKVLTGRPLAAQPGEEGTRIELPRTTATTTTLLAWPVAEALRPREVKGFHTTAHFSTPDDCNLLILTHPAFTEALQPLIAWKRERGLKVSLVETDDLYREHSAGTVSVDVLRDYIRHVYRGQPTPSLRYVMLVGDSISISKYVTHLPAYAYLQTGRHASENYYANFDDPTSLPLVAVGRLSVTTTSEVVNFSNKVLSYEGHADPGLWRARTLLIAASEAWASNDAETIRDNYVRPHYFIDYLRSDPRNSDPAYHTQINRELVGYLNAGQALTIFFGHGGGTVWEIGPTLFQGLMTKHLFDQSHVAELKNTTRPSLVLALTCYTNDFDNADVASTLGETFVNSPGGAIGVIGAAERSSTYFNLQFTREFYGVLNTRKFDRLGDAILETKRRINSTHINQTYLLLGDPSLEFRLPQPGITLGQPQRSADGNQLNVSYSLPAGTATPATLQAAILNERALAITSQTLSVSQTSGSLQLTLPETTQTLQRVLLYYGNPGTSDTVGTALIDAPTTATAQPTPTPTPTPTPAPTPATDTETTTR